MGFVLLILCAAGLIPFCVGLALPSLRLLAIYVAVAWTVAAVLLGVDPWGSDADASDWSSVVDVSVAPAALGATLGAAAKGAVLAWRRHRARRSSRRSAG